MSIVVFSPVREKPHVLHEFLEGLSRLVAFDSEIEYWFVDDNETSASSDLLSNFKANHKAEVLDPPQLVAVPSRASGGGFHIWEPSRMSRVAAIRDYAIARFLELEDASHLLLLDADTVVHPQTVDHLQRLNLPAVAEILWTQWFTGTPELPNCWDLHPSSWLDAERVIRLRTPGTYDVRGFGGLSLNRRDFLTSGVRYEAIPGLQLWGEDRYFATRAAVLGWQLHVDTHFPAVHLYNDTYFELLERWRRAGFDSSVLTSRLDGEWAEGIKRVVEPSLRDRVGNRLRRYRNAAIERSAKMRRDRRQRHV